MYLKLIIVFIILFCSSFIHIHGQETEEKLVVLHTQSGPLVIEFFPEDAPNHVENFINLTQSGFYDRTIFHRIIKDFMIQGGDPKTKPGAYKNPNEWGTGGPGYTIDAEFNDIEHNRGIVSMARSTDPNSAGSQFFIVHKDSNYLDGQYTVFGRLATQESYETLDKIANLETAPETTIAYDWGKGEILSAEVVNKSDVPNLLEQGPPERLSRTYTNERLGFSYAFPIGWLIQEPEKTNPAVPDVTAVGPKNGGFNPTVSVSVANKNEDKNLDERIAEIKDSLGEAIASGQVKILSEERIKINGMNAHNMILQGEFANENRSVSVNFNEINIEGPDKFYVITYADTNANFEQGTKEFEESWNSFKIQGVNETTTESNSNEKPNGGCLIATAAFGSELSPQVQKLRETRDNIVLKTEFGAAFIESFNDFYYIFSPTIADWQRENPIFKEASKLAITPLLYTLSILSHIEINSELDILGYGITIILLNIGIYFALPLVIIYRLKK